MKQTQVDKLNNELSEMLHPPYVQMHIEKRSRPHYKYEIYDHYDRYIVGAQTINTLRLNLNRFLSVD